jgi:hypothetical protein
MDQRFLRIVKLENDVLTDLINMRQDCEELQGKMTLSSDYAKMQNISVFIGSQEIAQSQKLIKRMMQLGLLHASFVNSEIRTYLRAQKDLEV